MFQNKFALPKFSVVEVMRCVNMGCDDKYVSTFACRGMLERTRLARQSLAKYIY